MLETVHCFVIEDKEQSEKIFQQKAANLIVGSQKLVPAKQGCKMLHSRCVAVSGQGKTIDLIT